MVAGVVAGVVLVELVLRLFGFSFALYPTQLQFGWPDPRTLGDVYVPDTALLWTPREYRAKVGAWKDRRPSVVFMGDSCTEFGAYDEALRSLVAERHLDGQYTFVNAGVGGWSSYQGLQQLTRDIVPMRPQVVTVYFGWNDHWASFGIEDKEIGRFNLEHPFLVVQLSRLRVIQLVNRALFAYRFSPDSAKARRPPRVSLADFRANLAQMVRIGRAHGITVVLLTAPSAHVRGQEPAYLAGQWLNDLRELVPLHEAYSQVVREVAATERAPLIDLFAELAKLPASELSTLFQEDGIHLTPSGDLEIGGMIYEYLVGNSLLQTTPHVEGRKSQGDGVIAQLERLSDSTAR
jgi:lysophospholipase L1-like esterase